MRTSPSLMPLPVVFTLLVACGPEADHGTPAIPDGYVLDADGDGFTGTADCDDARADVHPTAPDAEGDGVDADCDGVDGTGTATQTDTGTATPTGTDTATDTGTATPTGTDTATDTGTATPTGTDTGTDTGTPTDTDTGTDTGTSPTNAPPTEPEVWLAPSVPHTGDDLWAVTAATDADGDVLSYTFVWSLDGVEQPDVTGSMVPGDRVVRGGAWSVSVVASDGEDDSTAGTAAVIVANSAPSITAVTLSPAEVTTNTVLTANVTATDVDLAVGDSLSYTYVWFVDGVPVSGNGPTLDGATAFSKEQTVAVRVIPRDDADVEGPAMTSPDVTVLDSPPTAPVVGLAAEVYAELGAIEATEDLNQPVMHADVVHADRDGELRSFGVYASSTTCASIDFFVLSSSDVASGGWTLEWSESGSFSSAEGYQNVGDVGVAVTAGRYYAFGWATTCSSGVRFHYGLSNLPTDAGFGTVVGQLAQPYSGPATISAALAYDADYKAPHAMEVLFIPATGIEGEAFRCEVVVPSSDADGTTTEHVVAWTRNGVPHQPMSDGIVAGDDVRAGDLWSCSVTGESDGASSQSSQSSYGISPETCVSADALLLDMGFTSDVADESPYHKPVTIAGTAVSTPDRWGSPSESIGLDGATYFAVSGISESLSTGLTLSSWFQTSSSRTQMLFSRSNYGDASGEEFDLAIHPAASVAGQELEFSFKHGSGCIPGSGWQFNFAPASIVIGAWHHVAATFDRGSVALYFDGVRVHSANTGFAAIDSCGGDLHVGAHWSAFPLAFEGSVDDVRVANWAMSDQDIQALYEEPAYCDR